MSLLLDALHRASKDKEKAALVATHAVAAEPLIEDQLELTTPAASVATKPSGETPIALAPESSAVAIKPVVLELEMELAPAPVVATSTPQKSDDREFSANKEPEKAVHPVSENAALTAVVTAPAKRVDSFSKSTNSQAAAAAIQNAYAAPVLGSRRPPNRRAIVLAGIAGALGLALASFAFGVWGDPEQLLGLGGVSSVALPGSMQQAPAPVPPQVAAAVPDGAASSAPSPIAVPAPGAGSVVSAPPLLIPAAMPSVAVVHSPVADPKKPSNTQASEPVLRAASTVPVFASRARSQSALEVGYAALQAGRFDDASRAYAVAIEVNPSEPDALLGLAYIAYAKGQRDEAQNYYRRVLRQDPSNSVANAGLAALEAGASAGVSGTSQSERAKELAARQPESAAVQALAANALVQEGSLPDAALAFARAQALEPTNPLYAYNLAVALDKLGNYAQAASQYEKALRVNASATAPLGAPQASAARVRAAQLRQSLGQPQESAP